MADIFISYSSLDRKWVHILANSLRKHGLSVWWDPEIKPGEHYREVIQDALDNASCVIVVWSKNSIKSKWVQAEAAQAMDRGTLVPVTNENIRIPIPFNTIQTADLQNWNGNNSNEKFLKLISGISLHCEIIKGINSIGETTKKQEATPSNSHKVNTNNSNNSLSENPNHAIIENYKDGTSIIRDKTTDKYGVITKDKKIIIELIYDYVKNYNGGDVFIAHNNNKKYIMLDNSGRLLFSKELDYVNYLKKENIYFVRNKNKFGFMDSTGEKTIPLELELDIEEENKKYISNMDEYKRRFDSQYLFRDGHPIKVRKNKKYGLVSNKGKYLLHPEYDQLDYKNFSFHDDTPFIITKDRKMGVANKEGKILIDTAYDYIAKDSINNSFFEIRKDKKWGIANNEGKIIVEPVCHTINIHVDKHGNLAEFSIGIKTGLVSKEGTILVQPINLLSYNIQRNKYIKQYES